MWAWNVDTAHLLNVISLMFFCHRSLTSVTKLQWFDLRGWVGGRRVRFLVWVGQGGGFLASYFVVMYLLCYIPLFNRALMSVRFATIKYRTKIPQTRLRVCSYWPSARLAGTECMHGWKVSELLFWHLVWRNTSCVSGDVSRSCYLCFSNSIIVLG